MNASKSDMRDADALASCEIALRDSMQTTDQLRSLLREYLAMSSIDGRAERQVLRAKLKALIA
jgi:hypothetical protein